MFFKTFFRYCLCFVLLFMWGDVSEVQAQRLSDFYVSHQQDSFSLYFVNPSVMHDTTGKLKSLSCDFTYADKRDSVSMLMSVYSEEPLKALSVRMSSVEGSTDDLPIEFLFRKPEGKMWHNRMRVWLSYTDWKKLYTAQQPYTLFIHIREEQKLSFAMKSQKWKKVSKLYTTLFSIIELNRK